MRDLDRDGKLLCSIQGAIFEQSIEMLDCSSPVFVRRFMNSKVATELDSTAFLDDSKTTTNVFTDIEEEYGKSNYGRAKYHKDVMYWVGYLYRYFCYTYEKTSKQAYRYLPFDYVARSYEPYHSLSVAQAIERLLEAKNISFRQEELTLKGVVLLRKIRAERKSTKC